MKYQNSSKAVNDNEILCGKKRPISTILPTKSPKLYKKDLFMMWGIVKSLKKSSSDKLSYTLLKQLRTTNLENSLKPNCDNFLT